MKQKNFKEIYDVIYANVGNVMEIRRKTALRKNIFAFLLTFSIWIAIFIYVGKIGGDIIYGPLLSVGSVLTVIALMIIINKINKEYKITYKEQIINEIVKQSNSKLRYNYNCGISSREYAESMFDSGWDRYNTEDCIQGELEDGTMLRMAQVHTEERRTSRDSNGHTTTHYVTTFLGLYGIITLKTSTPADFMIKNNSKFAKFKKNRIDMESAEFEKYYDVYTQYSKNITTENRQNVMEILTPETIEEFIKIRNLFNRPINVRVSHNKIYFRISVGDIFEPPTFKSSVDFDMLKRYFLIIDVPRMLYEILIDNILVMYGDEDSREKRNISNMTDDEKKEFFKTKEKLNESTYFSHN